MEYRVSSLLLEVQKFSLTNSDYIKSMRVSIQRIDDQIALNGGFTGGWNNDDHSVFLKHIARLRIPNKDIRPMLDRLQGKKDSVLQLLIKSFCDQCPQVDQTSVLNHLEWYSTVKLLLVFICALIEFSTTA